jgi:hypothetical protein
LVRISARRRAAALASGALDKHRAHCPRGNRWAATRGAGARRCRRCCASPIGRRAIGAFAVARSHRRSRRDFHGRKIFIVIAQNQLGRCLDKATHAMRIAEIIREGLCV